MKINDKLLLKYFRLEMASRKKDKEKVEEIVNKSVPDELSPIEMSLFLSLVEIFPKRTSLEIDKSVLEYLVPALYKNIKNMTEASFVDTRDAYYKYSIFNDAFSDSIPIKSKGTSKNQEENKELAIKM